MLLQAAHICVSQLMNKQDNQKQIKREMEGLDVGERVDC